MNDSRFFYVDDPAVAVTSKGSFFVAWVDNRRQDVFFRAYSSGGEPLGDPVAVSRNPQTFSWLPRLAVTADDQPLVLWQEIIFTGGSHGGDALFARSTDGGRSFEPSVNLSSRSRAGDGKGRLTDHHGRIAVVWEHYPHVRPPPEGLGFTMSTDGGEGFSAPIIVPGTGTDLPGVNGSQQGILIRKLDINDGVVGIVNSGFAEGRSSTVRLVAGVMEDR